MAPMDFRLSKVAVTLWASTQRCSVSGWNASGLRCRNVSNGKGVFFKVHAANGLSDEYDSKEPGLVDWTTFFTLYDEAVGVPALWNY